MELKDFESVKNCEKCGKNTFIKDHKDEYIPISNRMYAPGEWTSAGTRPEHLKVTCSSCGYTWNEKCKS